MPTPSATVSTLATGRTPVRSSPSIAERDGEREIGCEQHRDGALQLRSEPGRVHAFGKQQVSAKYADGGDDACREEKDARRRAAIP